RRLLRAGAADRPLRRQADREQGRARPARGAARPGRARGRGRLRRPAGDAGGARASRHALHGAARAPSPRPSAAALRRRGRPVDLPGGVRDGRRRGRRGRRAAASRRPLRSRGGRRRHRRRVRPGGRAPRGLPVGRRGGAAGAARRPAGAARGAAAGARTRGPARRGAALELGRGGGAAARVGLRLIPGASGDYASRVGDEQRVSYDELLEQSRAAFEEVPDFTVAVEEEFALLDPSTLGLVNRFEEVQAAAAGTELEPHLVGELIASEVEVRTGRCETFADAAARLEERRAQLRALADGLGIGLSAVGTHPWSPWQEQRIIDTPHYRRNDEYLRYVVWRNNTFGLHVHVAVNDPDRAIRVCSALRNYMPELLAVSASSPFVEGVF